ncbi:MAG: Gfo/Idh/MocA family oxidoreductase [Opitutaceae bacterium]
MNKSPLRTTVVGLREPGLAHAACVAGLPENFTLAAGCDISAEARAVFTSRFPAPAAYSDFGDMLARERPEVVVLATSETPRCALALQAVESGVRGLYVEKPIAVSLGEALRR